MQCTRTNTIKQAVSGGWSDDENDDNGGTMKYGSDARDNGGEKKCKGRRLGRWFPHKESSSRI
jgi:hypothetical protein